MFINIVLFLSQINFLCWFKIFSNECKIVNKGLKVKLYPDDDLVSKINQNIGNARFTWNPILVHPYLIVVKGFNIN